MNSKLKNETGFTLVEVLIAIVILLIVVMSFTALFSSSYKGIAGSGQRSEALFGIQEEIERDLMGSASGETKSIVFTDNEGESITITGEHRTFKQVIIDDKEVMIDVFVHIPPSE